MGQLNPVAPTSLRGLPQRTIATGERLRVDQQNNVALGAAVLMPTVYDDDTIVIVRAVGDASASAIAISCDDGQLIDGAATVSLNWDRGVVVLGRDAELGGWCALAAPRLLDGSVGLVTKLRDIKGLVATSAGVVRDFDYALIGEGMNTAWKAGNFSTGLEFYLQGKAMTMLGANIFVKGLAAARTIRMRLWAQVSGAATLLATKDTPVTANQGLVQLRFDASQALPRVQGTTTQPYYRLGIWETSGNEFCSVTSPINFSTPSGKAADKRGGIMRPNVYITTMMWNNGDNVLVNEALMSSEIYPVTPVFSDDV